MRSLMGALLLGLAACDAAPPADTQKAEAPQGTARPAAVPGQIGKIDRSRAGRPAPGVAFTDHGGKERRIADFGGRPVLVNLWATWCAPCIAEMPALDRLAAREKDSLVVLPVSQDLEGWRAVDGFFTPGKFKALTPYLDATNALAQAVGAQGLPVSILYDAQGREVWRVNGPLEWDQPETARLIPSAAPKQPDPWADARARGVDFRAVGNEPGWSLEMDMGRQAKLVLDYGERTLTVPAPAKWNPGAANSYAISADGHAVAIAASPRTCSDGMSDASYPITVELKVDDKTYRGCGRAL